MTTRTTAPVGAPCWVDLWTSDVDGSRKFYSELLGWEAQAPSPEFGGYFMFTRDGVPVAGGMGDMGDMKANNTWKPYLSVPDIAETSRRVEAEGGQLLAPAMPIADLGVQAVISDKTGACVGAWQPGTFHGFSVIDEPGAPAWFELATRDFDAAIAFYGSVFDWETRPLPGTHGLRYATLHDAEEDRVLAGIMDASTFLPDDAAGAWSVYWKVADVDVAVAQLSTMGGTVVDGPTDTPFGRIASVTDPSGAAFKLCS